MSSDPGRRRELEELLRTPVDPMAPRPDTWKRIERQANRRKWVKASLGVAATVIVIAGAVPAVIAVRHNSSDQTLAISNSPGPGHTIEPTGPPRPPSPSPAAGFTGLRGFFPESLSFISQSEGFLWGSKAGSPHGVVAQTTDGGRTWVQRPAPPTRDGFVSSHGDMQIRFASGKVGFIFGAHNFITRDGGQSWQTLSTPGYVADLETVGGRIWALVRPCGGCTAVRLYSATAANPALKRVTQVPVLHGRSGVPEVAGAASVAVSGDHADVIVGSSGFWSTNNGRSWTPRRDPCPATVNGGTVQSALVSSTTLAGVVVACGYDVNSNAETKRLYASPDSGAHWTRLNAPTGTGYLQTISGGGGADIIVGTSRGEAQISHDGGATWHPDAAEGLALSFVGYINATHVVAVADRADSAIGAFATSENSGQSWTVTRFP